MISQHYDLDADALYIELANHQVARTVQVDAGTLVDLDASGGVVGIEVVHPGRAWPRDQILDQFTISEDNARELRTYFPHSAQLTSPEHPASPVPVAVG